MKQYRTLLLALLAVLALTVCALADEEEGDEPVTDTVVEVADQTVEIVSDPDAPQDNDELFYEYMLRLAREQMTPARPTREPTRDVHEQEMGLRSGGADGSRPPANVETAGSKLTGNDAIIYARLKTFIESVAAGKSDTSVVQIPMSELSFTVQGERTINTGEGQKTVYEWTKAQLGLSEGTALTDSEGISKPVSNALRDVVFQYHPKIISEALMADLPYSFYWYDKVEGYSYVMRGGIYTNETVMLVKGTQAGKVSDVYQLEFEFNVSQDYAVTDGDRYYPTSPNRELLAATAATPARAQAVVDDANYSGFTDYERLSAYRDWLCTNVDYNHSAADNENTPYGDPWQLIWAFDGKANTNIVCEGYSKAFKYLCDLSTFNGNIQCYLVTGNMGGGTGAGPHMWNVVTMDDGANYLVDVTNCDGANPEYWGELFLKGVDKNVEGSLTYDNRTYAKNYQIAGLSYAYDTDTLNLWGNGTVEGSILDLSTTDYSPAVFTPVAAGNYSYRLDGSKLYLKLNTGAKVIVACYTDGKMTSVQVVTTSNTTDGLTLTGNDWAIFSVDAETYAPLCGAVRKTTP